MKQVKTTRQRSAANIWQAMSYINKSFPDWKAGKVVSPQFGQYLVSFESLHENQPGRIAFRVPRKNVDTRDTMGCVLKRMLRALGPQSERVCTEDVETYVWNITSQRRIVAFYKRGQGTFIQLRDDAPATGVIA